MPQISQADMMEATRLTREGRLDEAMAILQGTRRASQSTGPTSGSVSEPSAAAKAPPKGPSARSSRSTGGPQPFLDMVAPSASGGSWTAPSAKGAPFSAGVGATPSEVPTGLRGLMDRMNGLGTAEGTGASLSETLMAKLGGSMGGTARPASVAIPEDAKFDEHLYTNAAGSRPYKVYVPSTYEGQPLPLVVLLHGCTQSPDDFAAGTKMNELAEEMGFLVAYPGQTQAANMQKCWNWFNAADQQRDQGEPSLLAGITRTVMKDFSVEPGQVYIAGLSAGGAAAAIMGATYPDLYAAVGVHSGLACGAAQDMMSAFGAMKQGGGASVVRAGSGQAVPTIIFHGDKDTTVHPVNGDEVATQAKAGAAHRTKIDRGTSPGGMKFTRTVHRDGKGQAMLEQWVLHGAAHAWSGGSAAGSYTDPKGPDASREMMRFFLEHKTPAALRR